MSAVSPPILGRITASALLLVMGALWGLQFAMLKLAAEAGYSDVNILTIALVLLSIIFGGILAARRQIFSVDGARLRFLIITALLGYIFPLAAALHAAPHIPAGILTMIATLAPIVTIAVALILRTERVSQRRVSALVFGSLAVLIVFWPELDPNRDGLSRWMAVALIVPLCYGIEPIYIAAHWPKGMTALQAVTGETWAATLLIAPVFLMFGDAIEPVANWSGAEIAIAVFVLAGVIESLIYLYLIQTTGGVFVSFGTFVSLFAGIAWGMALFGESHALTVWVAVAAMCASLLLACTDRQSEVRPRSG